MSIKKALPSRFILACENGHIEDFPYNWWVHKGRTDKCEKPKLRLEYAGKTGGLDSIIVSCAVCGAKVSMDNCLGKACTQTKRSSGFERFQ